MSSKNLYFNIPSFKIYFNEDDLTIIDKMINEAEEKTKMMNLDINYYCVVEKKIIKYIESKADSKNIIQIKKKIYEYIHYKFMGTDRNEKRSNLLQKIDKTFYEFLNRINSVSDINNYFPINFNYDSKYPEKTDVINMKEKLKIIQNKIWIKCYNEILKEYNNSYPIKNMPEFLMYDYIKILKRKIISILQDELNIPFYQLKISIKEEYILFKNIFLDFMNDKINMFDKTIFNIENKINIFKLIVLSNKDYLLSDLNKFIFDKYISKYITIIGLFDIKKELFEFYNKILTNNFDLNEKQKIFDSFKLYDNKKLLYLILFLSSLFNNLTTYSNRTDSEINVVDIHFSSKLCCSSRERKFLFNVLNTLDNIYNNTNNYCVSLNLMLENFIFKDLIKAYSIVLFDENNFKQIKLSFKRITQLINTSFNQEQKNEIDNETSHEYLFNSLSKEDSSLIYNCFKKFLEEYPFIKECLLKEEDYSFSSKFLDVVKSKITNISNKVIDYDEVNDISMDQLFITPLDPYIVSTHICLCINGKLLDAEDKDNIFNEKIFNLILKNQKNIEFYNYDWQDERNVYTNNTVKNYLSFAMNNFKGLFSKDESKSLDTINKENIEKNKNKNIFIAKIFGKFLAYILSSRSIFKFHSISLLGFSTGTDVIKYCLNEMNALFKNGVNINEIIYNIIFIGGASTLDENSEDKNLFNCVSGNVYNFYSKNNLSLKNNVNNSCIGVREITVLHNNDAPTIKNYDMTDYIYNQNNYQHELMNIIKEI